MDDGEELRRAADGVNAVAYLVKDQPLRLLRQGNFFDAFPLHLLTRTTLRTLARLAPESNWDERRFRPNLLVEADAPVTYTYYLDLNEKWEFQMQNRTLTVIAPDIRFNKPAVDASRITYEVKKDSHFRRTSPAMEALKSSITSMTKLKAKTNVELVRETGRRQTELFVRNWLAKSFSDGTNYAVNVQFRIETRTNAPAFRRPNG